MVSWSGQDNTGGVGLKDYDVQYRDGSGSWTGWRSATTQTSATFTGQIGHTYYFRSRARDKLDNLEAYPTGDGDTHTRVSGYILTFSLTDPPMAGYGFGRPSGINIATVIPGKVDFWVDAGGSFMPVTYTTSNQDPSVYATLDYEFQVAAQHRLKMEVAADGAQDYGRNKFDTDPVKTGRQYGVVWTFVVAADGAVTVTDTETY